MRGSTRHRHRHDFLYDGSPAHAGIDLLFSSQVSCLARLPRACGDRPVAQFLPAVHAKAPPRMRGSTIRRQEHRRLSSGSPAHAGIDRYGGFVRRSLPRLPRACGDRPFVSEENDHGSPAPPRMRGSTYLRGGGFKKVDGSPAHAGIDPRQCRVEGLDVGLPRACGDRPYVRSRDGRISLAPPRMRGSTPTASRRPASRRGSPAHAGIDPLVKMEFQLPDGLPRACGDRPGA